MLLSVIARKERTMRDTKSSAAAPAPDRKIHPIEEVGERLGGLSRSFVYKLIREGELASITIGKRRFVSEAALDAFIARREAA
jgi:excisionase family DNA binding protein